MGNIESEKVHVAIAGMGKNNKEVSSRDVELAEAVRHLYTYYMAYNINRDGIDIEQLRNTMSNVIGEHKEIGCDLGLSKDSSASEVVLAFDNLSNELQKEVIEHMAKESSAYNEKDETVMKLDGMIKNVNFESLVKTTEYVPGRKERSIVTGPKEFGIGLLEKRRGHYKRHW